MDTTFESREGRVKMGDGTEGTEGGQRRQRGDRGGREGTEGGQMKKTDRQTYRMQHSL